MELCQLDPYVRFAASVLNGVMHTEVKVTDCRIFYVEKGEADIHLGDTCCHIRKNSLFYCCAGSIYRIQTQGDLQLVCINFDLTGAHRTETLPIPVCPRPEQWESMPVYYVPIEDSAILNGHLLVEDASWLLDPIRELVREHAENTPLSSLLCGSLLRSILLRLHRAEQQEMPPKLRLVQDHIRANYRSPITNKQLGELTGYHEYYLNRMFRSYVGMSLHAYLTKVRMEQAAYLILNTQLPLSAVAEAVGIRSYPHFSASFKAFYGCAPTHFNPGRE